jgi:uncharacterized protein YgiM (DUF1202 family)
MRRTGIFLCGCAMLLLVATSWSSSGTMSVQVRDGQLRSTPSFLGSLVGAVAYGTQVEVMQQQGEWLEVRTPSGGKGWIHNSALGKKQVALQSGGQNVETTASGKELALAGKGFNADIEAEFRKSHQNLDYTWVNKMENINISPQEVLAFLKAGDVRPVAGGVQ